MQAILISAVVVGLLFLQALLLPIMAESIDIAARVNSIGPRSWRALAIYVSLICTMGYWIFAGAPKFGALERGKKIIYCGMLLETLPLWAFMNGFTGGHITDLIPLWPIPISLLVAGAAISKDWKDMVKAIVIGFSIPIASLWFLASFVDFGN